jgi:hypothetical protein
MTMHLPRLPIALDPLIAEAKRRMRRRRFLVAVMLLGVAALAVGLTLAVRPGGPERPPGGVAGSALAQQANVSASGQIGPLQIDQSTRADVIAFAGRPGAETRGQYANYARFDALGYACRSHVATNQAGVPECKTVYYLVARTGRLSLMFTRDPRYAYRGVHPGTVLSAAQHDLHRHPGVGCYTGFAFGRGAAHGAGTLVMEIFTRSSPSTGYPGGYAPRTHTALRNTHIGFLAVQSPRLGARNQNNPGVLDCIDS